MAKIFEKIIVNVSMVLSMTEFWQKMSIFGVMKNIVVLLMIVAGLMSCASPIECELQKGDLLFVMGDSSSEFSDAITDATAHDEAMPQYDHVAIVDIVNEKPCVIEAVSRGGVKETSWDEFMQSAMMVDGRCGVVVMRLNVDVDFDEALSRARSHIGEEYDWSFRQNNGKMYCSELVYESYLDNEGRHLFDAGPMSFRDAEGNMPQFWIDLFAKLGENVPEGEYGTNPTDMSKSKMLVEVGRLF